ncbi:hypothetical protein ACFX1X_014952 [Malus domestica]|nr:mitogen-activated protein kinase kinase kinase 17-like [Malus domestica]
MVMEWIRGNKIGRGGFATIYKAKPKNPSSQLPALVAVKTTESGDYVTITPSKTAREFYNLVLEYVNGGTLADELKKNGGRLPEVEKAGETQSKVEVRGTPLYMAPESVNDNMYEACSDVWSLGCLVAEMAKGKPAWDHKPGANMFKVLMRIGGDEMPQI